MEIIFCRKSSLLVSSLKEIVQRKSSNQNKIFITIKRSCAEMERSSKIRIHAEILAGQITAAFAWPHSGIHMYTSLFLRSNNHTLQKERSKRLLIDRFGQFNKKSHLLHRNCCDNNSNNCLYHIYLLRENDKL